MTSAAVKGHVEGVVKCVQQPEEFFALSQGVVQTYTHWRQRRVPRQALGRLHFSASQFCSGCVFAEQCRSIAEEERLSGVAGGHVVLHGRPRQLPPPRMARRDRDVA